MTPDLRYSLLLVILAAAAAVFAAWRRDLQSDLSAWLLATGRRVRRQMIDLAEQADVDFFRGQRAVSLADGGLRAEGWVSPDPWLTEGPHMRGVRLAWEDHRHAQGIAFSAVLSAHGDQGSG